MRFHQNQAGSGGLLAGTPRRPGSLCPGAGLGSELQRQTGWRGSATCEPPQAQGYSGPARGLPHPPLWPVLHLRVVWKAPCRAARRPALAGSSWAPGGPLLGQGAWGKHPSSPQLCHRQGSWVLNRETCQGGGLRIRAPIPEAARPGQGAGPQLGAIRSPGQTWVADHPAQGSG